MASSGPARAGRGRATGARVIHRNPASASASASDQRSWSGLISVRIVIILFHFIRPVLTSPLFGLRATAWTAGGRCKCSAFSLELAHSHGHGFAHRVMPRFLLELDGSFDGTALRHLRRRLTSRFLSETHLGFIVETNTGNWNNRGGWGPGDILSRIR